MPVTAVVPSGVCAARNPGPASGWPDRQACRYRENQLHPVNGRRPLPSLLRNSPAFVLLAIALADAGRFVDSDLWNHLSTGQIILGTRHLIRYDPYSYTAFGHPWRNYEWLSEVVLGLKMLKLLCAAATISFLALGLAETGARPGVQRGVLVLIAIALVPQIQFRPQLATFVLLSLVLALLARDTYRSPPRLWPLIPIFALWANLHGNPLCDYNWGSYVIWHTAPESKVFIDGRCELVYTTKALTDYFEFYFGSPRMERVLSGYPNDFVLVPPDSLGYGVVSKNLNWKAIYRDPAAVLFA